ncbi:hypothetical protein NDU88_005340 [Pleurodeles waltl]|uniref:Uncharacterized protein n=1 Tax=Pleurodeles waltl TaxID=8319 RepID=A0AAV7MA83_PLEWA|nr:hypothetical protein NDU88_005340 [Pleurodeles waltl]
MPGGRSTDKPSDKPARQLLFSEALQLNKLMPSPVHSPDMVGTEQATTMDSILQEITAVSRILEGMDIAITSLTSETKSMHLDIAGFQSCVTGLEHRMATVEDHIHTVLDEDQELEFLRSKLIDLEDRSQRKNIRHFVFPEQAEGTETPSFLCSVLPQLTKTVFKLQLEFQRAHRLGLKRKDGTSKPRPI